MEKGAYRRCYEYLIRLQILDEVEGIAKVIYEPNRVSMNSLFSQWKSRTEFSQYSLGSLEPVLKTRRTLLEVAAQHCPSQRDFLNDQLGECWLISSKVARKAGQFSKAYNLLLEAEKFCHKETFIERAKLCWVRENKTEAIDVLQKGISEQFPNISQIAMKTDEELSPNDKEQKLICGKAKLLLARYVDDAANLGPEVIPSYYNEAKVLQQRSEDVFVYIARYFEKFIGKNYKESDLDGFGDIIKFIISNYARSLIFGCEHLHQSLARMLSLWLDYGSRVSYNEEMKTMSPAVRSDMRDSLEKMNENVDLVRQKVPKYYFLSVFPQLTSRICHVNDKVWAILESILVDTFFAYPHHVFWHMVALHKSSISQRSQRCKQIFKKVKEKLKKSRLEKLLDEGANLAERLLELCDAKLEPGRVTLRDHMPRLMTLCNNNLSSKILLPTTANMTVMLPSGPINEKVSPNPFPDELVYIAGIEDNVEVMKSLIKPKKITFRGTNGQRYSFLCKPKDDLRRDSRLLDMNNLLNKLFKKDPECRKRNLHIRTYVRKITNCILFVLIDQHFLLFFLL